MLENPGQIEGTVKLTMTLKEWEMVRDQMEEAKIGNKWPTCEIRDALNDMFSQARKIFYPTITEKEQANG